MEERIYPEVRQIQSKEEYPIVSEVLTSYYRRAHDACGKHTDNSTIWAICSGIAAAACWFGAEYLVRTFGYGFLPRFIGVFLIFLFFGALQQIMTFSDACHDLEIIVNYLIEMKDRSSIFWTNEETIAIVNLLIEIFNEAMEQQGKMEKQENMGNPDISITFRHKGLINTIASSLQEQKLNAAA